MKEDIKLARWLNDEMDSRELQEFMAQPEFETYRKIKEYSAELTAPDTDIDALYTTVAKNRNKKGRVLKLTPWLSKIAAVLIIAIGVTYFFYTTHTTTQIADFGQHSEFFLPDNSSVVMNAGSEAEYKSWNWDNNREIELKGEAYFKVAKGKTFDVVTKNGTVTVVGTQFNVKSRDNRFEVTCFEGKVKVTAQQKTVLLSPGENIIFEGGTLINIPPGDGTIPGWIGYEAKFYDESLEAIAKEMERQYNVTITVPQVDKKFTGTLPLNNIDEALQIIETAYTAYNIKYLKNGKKIILTTE